MTLHAYDPLGDSSDNLVLNETHNVSTLSARCIIADSGLFYTNSVIIKKQANNQPLVLGTDYEFFGFDPEATFITGLESACAIVLKNDTIAGVLVLQYQAVGGTDAEKTALVEDLRRRILGLQNGTVTWAEILDKPSVFPPAPHQHNILTDLTNVTALAAHARQIVEALTSSRVPVLAGVNLNAKIERVFVLLGYVRNELNKMAIALSEKDTLVLQLTRAANYVIADEFAYITNWDLTTPVVKLSKYLTWDAGTDSIVASAIGLYQITTTVTARWSSAIVDYPNEIAKLKINGDINHWDGISVVRSVGTPHVVAGDNIATFTFTHILQVDDLLTQNNTLQFAMASTYPPVGSVTLSATVVGTKL